MSKELTYGSELRIIICVIAGVVAALLYHERVKKDAGVRSETGRTGELGGLADGDTHDYFGSHKGE